MSGIVQKFGCGSMFWSAGVRTGIYWSVACSEYRETRRSISVGSRWIALSFMQVLPYSATLVLGQYGRCNKAYHMRITVGQLAWHACIHKRTIVVGVPKHVPTSPLVAVLGPLLVITFLNIMRRPVANSEWHRSDRHTRRITRPTTNPSRWKERPDTSNCESIHITNQWCRQQQTVTNQTTNLWATKENAIDDSKQRPKVGWNS